MVKNFGCFGSKCAIRVRVAMLKNKDINNGVWVWGYGNKELVLELDYLK